MEHSFKLIFDLQNIYKLELHNLLLVKLLINIIADN